MNDPIQTMRNLGPASQEMLNRVGIFSLADIVKNGAVECYLMVKTQHAAVSLNLLYAMQAAVMDIDWRELPAEIKVELKQAVETANAEQNNAKRKCD